MIHKNIKKIKILKNEIILLEKELNNSEKEARELLKPKYKIKVTESNYLSILDRNNEINESGLPNGIRIILNLINKDIFDNHFYFYKCLSDPVQEVVNSVHMSLLNNVLITNGGGTHLLKKNSIITNDEWESILSGTIPEHLKCFKF